MKAGAIFFVTMVAWAALTEVKAATYSLEPVADARLLSRSDFLHQNYASDILSVYTATSELNTQRTCIQFDLSAIATNQQVQSATLTLIAATSFGDNSTHQPMEIYRLVSAWSETGMTWLNRDATHLWTNPGGDFVGTNGQPYAVSTLAATNGQPVTWDVTALVQEWVTHPATNFGLALISRDGNHLVFAQREAGTAAVRPKLTVIVGELPPFHIYSSGGQLVLWWTSTNSILQEKTNLNPAVAWSDSGRSVTQSNGSNSVTVAAPKGNNFFRLRGGP